MARKRGVTPKQRFRIMRRDGFSCCLCGRKAKDGVQLQVDHKVPFSKGGSDKDENLWTLCQPCNSGKSDSPILLWGSGHPQPAFKIAVFNNLVIPDGEEVWFFNLPDGEELDDEKRREFDRYVLSEFNLEHFMRPTCDVERRGGKQISGDPAIFQELRANYPETVIVHRTSAPGLRVQTFC